jgi:hypothetical protein
MVWKLTLIFKLNWDKNAGSVLETQIKQAKWLTLSQHLPGLWGEWGHLLLLMSSLKKRQETSHFRPYQHTSRSDGNSVYSAEALLACRAAKCQLLPCESGLHGPRPSPGPSPPSASGWMMWWKQLGCPPCTMERGSQGQLIEAPLHLPWGLDALIHHSSNARETHCNTTWHHALFEILVMGKNNLCAWIVCVRVNCKLSILS